MPTRRQQEALNFIRGYIAEHQFSPSLDEIGAVLGIPSKSAVHRIVMALVGHGLIRTQPGRVRSIEVVEQPDLQHIFVAVTIRRDGSVSLVLGDDVDPEVDGQALRAALSSVIDHDLWLALKAKRDQIGAKTPVPNPPRKGRPPIEKPPKRLRALSPVDVSKAKHPKPWHAEAARLRAEGVPVREIAERLGVGQNSITYLFYEKARISSRRRVLARRAATKA